MCRGVNRRRYIIEERSRWVNRLGDGIDVIIDGCTVDFWTWTNGEEVCQKAKNVRNLYVIVSNVILYCSNLSYRAWDANFNVYSSCFS